MKDLPILDAHVHFWQPDALRYPWLDGLPALNRPFLPADYVAASGSLSIAGLIFVECGCAASQRLDEGAWVSELAKTEPRLKGIVAQAPVERGRAVREDLLALAANPLVKGVRRILQGEPDEEFCLRPGFVAGVQALAEFGFSFDLCLTRAQLPAATRLAERCPEVTFILDHCGKPDIRNRQLEPWRQDFRALAGLPNVCCKLSGLATEADCVRWCAEDLKPVVNHAVECFGCERLLFGSDWPVATLATDLPRWAQTLRELLPVSEIDLAQVFHHNAARIYRV
jgi:L-fuconolactonase